MGEARRHRNVLLDSGDESARLKVQAERMQSYGGRREFDGGRSKGTGKRSFGPVGGKDAGSKGYGGKVAASGAMHYGAGMPVSKGYPPVGMGMAGMHPGGYIGGKPGFGPPGYHHRAGAIAGPM